MSILSKTWTGIKNFFKKSSKKDLVIGALVVLLLLNWFHARSIKNDLKDVVRSIEQSTEYIVDTHVNDLGQTVNTMMVTEFDKNTTKVLEQTDLGFKKTVERIEATTGAKIKNLQSSISFKLEALGQGMAESGTVDSTFLAEVRDLLNDLPTFPVDSALTVIGDASKLHTFKFDDSYLTAAIVVPDTHDKLFMNYKYSLGNVYVDVFSIPKAFKKDEFKTNVTFDNPNLTMKNAHAVVRSFPKVKFAFGPTLVFGVSYVDGTFKPVTSIGVGGMMPLIRIYDK